MKISKESRTKQVTYFEYNIRLTDDELNLVRIAVGGANTGLALANNVALEDFVSLYKAFRDLECE